MKNKFKVCIIGCGVIFRNHIVSLLALDNVEISALCDIKAEKAERMRNEYALDCPVYSDYIKMLDEINPDAVHILTPHYLHTQMTLDALERNINVFLEKPICIKEDDIQKLIDAESKSKARVCVSFQTRYNKAVKIAKQIIDEDGGAIYGSGAVIWNRSDEYYASGDWRGKCATEGGGVLINQAIHTIDLLHFFLGIPKKVQAICSKMRHGESVEVEDTCQCIIDFDNGKRANLLATTTYCGHDSTTLRIESKNHVVEIRDQWLYVDGELIETEKSESYIGKKCYGNSHMIAIESFYTALSEGSDMQIPLSDAQYAVKIILAAYKSNSQIIEL